MNDLVVDGTALNTTVTIGNGEGIVANALTATGVISNTKVTENITVASEGGATSGGCFAGTVAEGGMVPAQSVGNVCLAGGHNHAEGDTLVNNLKTAPKLVSAVFVSKSGKEGGAADRVFGDWATDIRVAGDIEMTFTFDKAMNTSLAPENFKVTLTGASTEIPATQGVDPDPVVTNWTYTWVDSRTVKVILKQTAIDYAVDYSVKLSVSSDSQNYNKDTLGNVFTGYYLVDSANKYVWNFRTIGGLPVISAPKLYNITGTTATVFFAYEMNAMFPI